MSKSTLFRRLQKPIKLVLTYLFWIVSVRLITLSFVTYFIISPTSHFQDISDTFSSYEIILMGFAALLYVFLICNINPLSEIKYKDFINRENIEKGILPGFIQGAFFAGGMTLSFILGGIYRYLGYFFQVDDALNLVIQMTALVVLSFSEEFIFHVHLKKRLSNCIPQMFIGPIIAICYCGTKMLQFDLGIMHLITLYLVSLSLFYRSEANDGFARGAGFWAGILIVFHPLLSLPIFGNGVSGILLIKYQVPLQGASLTVDNSNTLIRYLTGGAGGPLSSVTFQLLLLLDIARSILKKKKIKLSPPLPREVT